MARKIVLGLLWLAASLPALGQTSREAFCERVADAIYIAEGGANTRFPYGVRSIQTSDPRRVCVASVRNNLRRWDAAGRPGEFIAFMGRRYCPPDAHPLNRHWVKNVTHHLNAQTPKP